jgi:hypothetical protein
MHTACTSISARLRATGKRYFIGNLHWIVLDGMWGDLDFQQMTSKQWRVNSLLPIRAYTHSMQYLALLKPSLRLWHPLKEQRALMPCDYPTFRTFALLMCSAMLASIRTETEDYQGRGWRTTSLNCYLEDIDNVHVNAMRRRDRRVVRQPGPTLPTRYGALYGIR